MRKWLIGISLLLVLVGCGDDLSADGRLQNFLFDPSPLPAPTNVQVAQDGQAAVLSWQNVQDADIYLIYIAENQPNNFYRRNEQFSVNVATLESLPTETPLFFLYCRCKPGRYFKHAQ